MIQSYCTYGIFNEQTDQCLEEGDYIDRLTYLDNGNEVILEDAIIDFISKEEIEISTEDYEGITIPIEKIVDWD